MRILFACVGNSARSQIAEGFLKKYCTSVQVSSAGTSPASRISEKAVKVMSEKGIDISRQTPKAIDSNEIKAADLIITMGCGAGACPIAPPEKVREWKIDDPYDKSIDEFREIRDEIEDRVRELLNELKKDNF